jgi:hypothetical protein
VTLHLLLSPIHQVRDATLRDTPRAPDGPRFCAGADTHRRRTGPVLPLHRRPGRAGPRVDSDGQGGRAPVRRDGSRERSCRRGCAEQAAQKDARGARGYVRADARRRRRSAPPYGADLCHPRAQCLGRTCGKGGRGSARGKACAAAVGAPPRVRRGR